MSEEISRCPKCRQYESFLFNSFDECVSYTHCACIRSKPKRINGKLPLDIALEAIDRLLKEKRDAIPKQ
jgi:hypothetical protein